MTKREGKTSTDFNILQAAAEIMDRQQQARPDEFLVAEAASILAKRNRQAQKQERAVKTPETPASEAVIDNPPLPPFYAESVEKVLNPQRPITKK